jgi:hypothetical protein
MTRRPVARFMLEGIYTAAGDLSDPALGPEGKIHRADPDFGPTLTVSSRDSQSKYWVNWKITGQPCESQARRPCSPRRTTPTAR